MPVIQQAGMTEFELATLCTVASLSRRRVSMQQRKALYYIRTSTRNALLCRLKAQIRPIDVAAVQFIEVQQVTEVSGAAQ